MSPLWTAPSYGTELLPLTTAQTPEEFRVGVINVEQELYIVEEQSIEKLWQEERTCLTRLFLGDLFGRLHPVQGY